MNKIAILIAVVVAVFVFATAVLAVSHGTLDPATSVLSPIETQSVGSGEKEHVPDDQADLEKMVEFKTSIETRWKMQDVITVTFTNPLSRQLKGTLFITLPKQKPVNRRFSLRPGKSETMKFTPDIVWDGRSSVTAEAEVKFDGFDTPVLRTIDLGTKHRITARPSSPLGRTLEFRIISPSGRKEKGKLKLFDVKGIKPHVTTLHFEVESRTVVTATLEEPAPKEFSFGYRLIDAVGREILRTPVLNYIVVEDFSSATEGEPMPGYKLAVEGDPNVPAQASADGGKRDTLYTALPSILTCRIKYEFGEGERSLKLVPEKELPMPGMPIELGFWVHNDGGKGTGRCRFADSTGQVFESEGFDIDWRGWRYKVLSLEGNRCDVSGGASDGKVHCPIRWDSIFTFDAGGQESRGTIYIGPIMLVSEPMEQSAEK